VSCTRTPAGATDRSRSGNSPNLYGAGGFDVLAVTDRTVRSDDPWFTAASGKAGYIDAGNHAAYLAEIDAEAERARELYGLVVLPGLELTYNDAEPARAAHAVAIGLRSYVSVDQGIEPALEAARAKGAALVAAHPYTLELAGLSTRVTAL
jgi:3',5'-nucleoside bisphosphate phosphatase